MAATYRHKVQYYETDQMGVVHHSNYIRWMEEARIDFMDSIGVNYAKLEQEGYISPVLKAVCEYKSMSRFGESVIIRTQLEEFGNVKFRLTYRMEDEISGELRAEGETLHCFLNVNGEIISLKKENRLLYERFYDKLT